MEWERKLTEAEADRDLTEERDAAARILCAEGAAMLREVFYFIDQSNERDLRAEALIARLEAVSK